MLASAGPHNRQRSATSPGWSGLLPDSATRRSGHHLVAMLPVSWFRAPLDTTFTTSARQPAVSGGWQQTAAHIRLQMRQLTACAGKRQARHARWPRTLCPGRSCRQGQPGPGGSLSGGPGRGRLRGASQRPVQGGAACGALTSGKYLGCTAHTQRSRHQFQDLSAFPRRVLAALHLSLHMIDANICSAAPPGSHRRPLWSPLAGEAAAACRHPARAPVNRPCRCRRPQGCEQALSAAQLRGVSAAVGLAAVVRS